MWHDSEAYKGSCGDMDFDPGFKQDSILEQLNKVKDSAKIVPGVDCPIEKFHPFNTLVTDEGDEFVVTAEQAEKMYDIIVGVKPQDRLEVLKQVQTTKGLTSLLELVKI